MDSQVIPIAVAVLASGIVAGTVFFVLGRRRERGEAERAGRAAEQQAKHILREAERDAETEKAQVLLTAKEDIMGLREAWDREERERRDELDRHQARLEEREALIDRKLNTLDDRDRELDAREHDLVERDGRMGEREKDAERLLGERRARLESIAGMSEAEAHEAAERL